MGDEVVDAGRPSLYCVNIAMTQWRTNMNAAVFTGPEGVNRFVIVTLRSAIRLYKNTGMKANRAYTPTNMRKKAEELTGDKFKARDYDGMIAALSKLLGE
jgi:hypothetical protein